MNYYSLSVINLLVKNRGEGERRVLKERGSSLYDGGGGGVSRGLRISTKLFKLI